MTPQAASLAIGQIQQELGEIFNWSIDVENMIGQLEKNLKDVHGLLDQLLATQEQAIEGEGPTLPAFDAMAEVDKLLAEKAG